jgi:hypothetical protein
MEDIAFLQIPLHHLNTTSFKTYYLRLSALVSFFLGLFKGFSFLTLTNYFNLRHALITNKHRLKILCTVFLF